MMWNSKFKTNFSKNTNTYSTMKKLTKYFVAVLSAILLTGALSADVLKAQPALTAVPFLQIEPDSRMASMGNTGVGFADNSHAVFWNPAGLAFQEGNEASLTHANWLPNFDTDMFYDYLVGKYDVEGLGPIGAHITFFNLGEQTRTDESGNPMGTFRSYELATGLSYGYRLNENWALGTGLRFIYSNLTPTIEVGGQETQDGVSVGVDLSTMYKSNYFNVANRDAQFSFGANLSNLGPHVQYADEEQADPLPTTLRVGWSYKMDLDSQGYNTLRIANDYSKIMARRNDDQTAMNPLAALVNSWDTVTTQDDAQLTLAEQIVIGTGAEYWYDDLFALRAGYFYEDPNNGAREFISFGAGLRYSIVGVDFSYIYPLEEDHPLADTIRLTAMVNF